MIDIMNLSAGYGKKTVLENISLSFEKGKLISVVGENGSGKSTILKTIAGIILPVSGEIFCDGISLSSLKPKDSAKRIAYLSQWKSCPNMTVAQLVLHGRFPHLNYPRRYTQKDRETAFFAMEKMGISHLADTSITALSGGTAQKAFIAMALAQDTDYILLDEPTTYLDIAHQIELMKTLKDLALQGKGVVIVIHDLPLAFKFSHEAVILNKGKLLLRDTPENLSKSHILKETFGVSLFFDKENGGYSYDY